MKPEEQRAERRAGERPRAAEDVDAADDDRRDDREGEAARGRPVDRPELDDPHDAGDTGEQAAQREGDEDDEPRRDAEDGGRFRVAADRVELPAEPRPAQDDRPDRPRRRRRSTTKTGIPKMSSWAASVKPGGRPATRHLVAAGDEVVDAAEDAQRAERGDDGRDPEDRDDEAVDHPEDEPDADPEQDRATGASKVWFSSETATQ